MNKAVIFLRDRWPLLVVLLVFIILKLPHLDYLFYWDESWPYASAVNEMYQKGVSLSPIALGGEISRGHPLFFHAAAATWMNIFGDSNVVMHSFPLFISVCTLIGVYEAGLRFFNKNLASLAVILLAFQVAFFVQASFVLLEVLVGCLAFFSIYFYVREKHFLTGLFLSMLFYTKESGLVVAVVLGIDAWITFFRAKLPLRERVFKLVSIAVPIVLIGIFFLVQKYYKGWYFLPLYNDLIEKSWDSYFDKFKGCLHFLFDWDDRFRIYQFIGVLSIITAIRTRAIRHLVVLLPIAAVYIIFKQPDLLSKELQFVFVLVSFIGTILYLAKEIKEIESRRFVVLAGLFCVAFCLFTAFNLFIPRYLIASLVPSLFVAATLVYVLSRHSAKWLLYLGFPVVVGISAWAFHNSKGHFDIEMGAFDAMEVQEEVVDFLEERKFYDKKIAAGGYLERIQLTDPNTGQLSSGKVFTDVKWEIEDDTEIIIFDSIEPDEGRHEQIKNDQRYKLLTRIERGRSWAEIYQKTGTESKGATQ